MSNFAKQFERKLSKGYKSVSNTPYYSSYVPLPATTPITNVRAC